MAQLNFSQPVYTPPQKDTVNVVEQSYIKKPLITETQITIEEPPKPLRGDVSIVGKSNEQCVVFARRITGNPKIRGYAGNLTPEGHDPAIGAIALEPGHVSVVESIIDGKVVVKEANYRSGYITMRTIPISSLNGFIYAN